MKLSTTFPVLCALALAQHAYAQDGGCDAVTVGTPIYLGGSTALQPFVKTVGPKLAAQSGAPYTVFYFGGGSCTGVNNIVDPVNNSLAASTSLTYYVTSADGGVDTKSCTLPASQTKLDLAISDVFEATCTSRPSSIGDFLGPAQSMVFVVPNGSTQTAITAEEAYIAIGFGGSQYQASPWNADPNNTFWFRANSSGTKLVLASVIGVPAAKWKGQATSGSGAVIAGITAATGASAENSLGILGLDYLDQTDTDGTPRRTKIKELALAAYGQKYAYYPDSTKTSYDKRNLRNGRYAGLGYAHFIAPVDGAGVPTSAKVKYIIDLFTGATVTPAPSFDVAQTVAKDAHLVPLCAMKVKRDAEGGDLKAFKPAADCSCYFESLVGATSTSCVQCSSGTCASGSTCRNGWCEAN